MGKLAGAALVLIALTGCASIDFSRIVELERRVAELESELENVVSWGADPAGIEVPPELEEEIEDLAVGPPYLETAISIFPGFFLPGLGAHAIGDSDTGWRRFGEAYTGVGEFALGTGMTIFTLAAVSSSSCSGNCDGLGEFFFTGLAYMVTGPIHYLEAWLGDVASTYGSRKSLSMRIARLKLRYLKFIRSHESACAAYASGAR
jgi:hypothetical protein